MVWIRSSQAWGQKLGGGVGPVADAKWGQSLRCLEARQAGRGLECDCEVVLGVKYEDAVAL